MAGTVFFGGLDVSGGYMADMQAALEEAGVADVSLGTNGLIPLPGLHGSLLDQTLQAGLVFRYRSAPLPGFDPRHHLPQPAPENLIGYSFGGLIAAQIAYQLVSVRRLFLVACPISEGFLNDLRAVPRLRVVEAIDLLEEGDPLRVGMSDMALLQSLPLLTGQLLNMSGHFIHARDDQLGARNRRRLVSQLRARGL
ncbi:hypothetical protein JCM17960_17230 [Magnetospira thiophila]